MRHAIAFVLVQLALFVSACTAQPQSATPAATNPVGRFPFLEVDARAKRIRVECEALHCRNPLEFFCCVSGTNEHEAVLRSGVKPSHLHAALLMLGLQPGEGVRFSEAQNKWLPPHGPPLAISVEFEKEGKTIALPGYRLMRDVRSKREMKPMTWIFSGSRIMPDGTYGADATGYLVSVVNFELSVIDVPQLASSANETLEWETNLDLMPALGAKVIMVIEPAGKVEAPSATQSAKRQAAGAPIDEAVIKIDADGHVMLDDVPVTAPARLPEMLKQRANPARRVRVAVANPIEENPTAREVINTLSAANVRFVAIPQATAQPVTRPVDIGADVRADDALIQRLREKWEQSVAPRGAAMREAARTHYDVINQLRREQQRLIDEADRIQRLIDQLEKQYQEMTTPSPQ